MKRIDVDHYEGCHLPGGQTQTTIVDCLGGRFGIEISEEVLKTWYAEQCEDNDGYIEDSLDTFVRLGKHHYASKLANILEMHDWIPSPPNGAVLNYGTRPWWRKYEFGDLLLKN